MTNANDARPKRVYSTPKLVACGNMAQLTKSGGASIVEGTTMNMR